MEKWEEYIIEDEYKDKYIGFYKEYLDDNALNEFFNSICEYEDKHDDNIPRRMMHQVQRFVKLAIDVEKIEPNADMFRIIFLNSCLDSIFYIANQKKDKINFFENWVSIENQEYILNNFKICIDEDYYSKECKLTIKEFHNVFYKLRNIAIHEGNCWCTQFFNENIDCGLISVFYTEKNIFENSNDIKWYTIDTTLSFYEFIKIFVRGCVNFIINQCAVI
jgi:hypothetical protein